MAARPLDSAESRHLNTLAFACACEWHEARAEGGRGAAEAAEAAEAASCSWLMCCNNVRAALKQRESQKGKWLKSNAHTRSSTFSKKGRGREREGERELHMQRRFLSWQIFLSARKIFKTMPVNGCGQCWNFISTVSASVWICVCVYRIWCILNITNDKLAAVRHRWVPAGRTNCTGRSNK